MLTYAFQKVTRKNELTWTAICFICLSSLEIKTKKMMREMMVMTTTTMPQNSPVLAWLQSTLYCWCLDNRGYCGDKYCTIIPQKRPLLAWLQSTLYCWCLDNWGYCGDKDNNATEETSVGMAAVHTVLLVPTDNRGYCGDKDNNATEESSVGMAAVHTVLLVPRQQSL